MKRLDLTNKRFGKIVCIKPLEKNNHGEIVWLCKCDCGNYCQKSSGAFKNISKIASCGCMKGKKPHNVYVDLENYKPIHECYTNMKTRCYNKKYKLYSRYGGRGIKVCNEWLNDFINFYNWAIKDWKKGLTLDRINNDGNYEPSNCKWSDRIEQANNRHTNYIVEFNGERKTLAQWSKTWGIKYSYMQNKLYKGENLEQIIKEWSFKNENNM